MIGYRKVRMTLVVLAATPPVALLFAFGFLATANIVRAYRLSSSSMYPTVQQGDRIIVRNTRLPWTRGQLVTYQSPQNISVQYLKRVVGISGDEILIQDGALFLNGKKVERLLSQEPCQETGCSIWVEKLDGRTYKILLHEGYGAPDFGPFIVPEGHVFVLGDNRDNSMDSRHTGPIPNDLVTGIPEFIYWSSDDKGRIGQLLR